MTFWCRIKQSQLRFLSNHLKRCCSEIQGPYVVDPCALGKRVSVMGNPCSEFYKRTFDFGSARFFAAPVQFKQKQEEKDSGGVRMNEKISAPYVRLVTDEGHAIVPRREALERARRLEMDLVEVDRKAEPPVCKLMDYHKEKYKKQVKEKERIKVKHSEVKLRKTDCKEVRIAAKIEEKDLQMKADAVRRLIERGYRVKCTSVGKENEDLAGLLSRLSTLIEGYCIFESEPKVEKKQAFVVVRHTKFGPKKGSGKKNNVLTHPTNDSSALNSVELEQNWDTKESGSKNGEDIFLEEDLDENIEKNKSTWSVFDKNDGLDDVVQFKDDLRETPKDSPPWPMNGAADIPESPLNTFRNTPSLTENRYKSGTENRYARSPTRFKPQFQNQGRQNQFDLNTKTTPREPVFNNEKVPTNEFSPKEIPPPSIPRSPSSSFGIFSTPKSNFDPQTNSGTTEVNRYKRGPNPDARSSNLDGHGRPPSDRFAQGRR